MARVNSSTVAVLGLPHLASALAEAGLDVVSGPTVREAASAIQGALKSEAIPVILADASAPMLNSWFAKVIGTAPTVLVRVDSPAQPITAPGATRRTAPVLVDDVLSAVGLEPALPGATLDASGDLDLGGHDPAAEADDEAPTPAEPETKSADDTWLDEFNTIDDTPAPSSPAPASPAETALAPVAPQAEDDWDDLGWEETAPAPADVVQHIQPSTFEGRPAPTAPSTMPTADDAEGDDWADLAWPDDSNETPASAPVAPIVDEPPFVPDTAPGFSWDSPVPVPVPTAPRRPIAIDDEQSFSADEDGDAVAAPGFLHVSHVEEPVAAPTPSPQADTEDDWGDWGEEPSETDVPPAPDAADLPSTAQPDAPASQPHLAEAAIQVGEVTGTFGIPETFSPAIGRHLAPVVLSVAGKGGVGKTSVAVALAQRAAAEGKKVALVDGNRGQGDIRIYLGLARSGLPTLYDAATTGDVASALITPDRLNAARPPHMARLDFALILAPPQQQADTSIITAELYDQAIAHARAKADLVVIDTQIVEGAERGLFDDLFIPAMKSYAWTVGISDLSSAGVSNLLTNMSQFLAAGVTTERTMTMLNRVPASTEFDQQSTAEALGRFGRFVAAVPVIDEVHAAMAHGESIHDNPVLAPVLDDILHAVTRDAAFAPRAKGGRMPGPLAGKPSKVPSKPTEPSDDDDAPQQRRGLLARLRRRS